MVTVIQETPFVLKDAMRQLEQTPLDQPSSDMLNSVREKSWLKINPEAQKVKSVMFSFDKEMRRKYFNAMGLPFKLRVENEGQSYKFDEGSLIQGEKLNEMLRVQRRLSETGVSEVMAVELPGTIIDKDEVLLIARPSGMRTLDPATFDRLVQKLDLGSRLKELDEIEGGEPSAIGDIPGVVEPSDDSILKNRNKQLMVWREMIMKNPDLYSSDDWLPTNFMYSLVMKVNDTDYICANTYADMPHSLEENDVSSTNPFSKREKFNDLITIPLNSAFSADKNVVKSKILPEIQTDLEMFIRMGGVMRFKIEDHHQELQPTAVIEDMKSKKGKWYDKIKKVLKRFNKR